MASYYSSKLPTSNLKAEDIRDTLAAGGGSVSNDTTTFFKAAAKINPFSKHKPIKLAVDFCQDINSSNPNYDADWWKGTDGNCGLTPRGITSYSELVSLMESGDEMNGWQYSPPVGGSSQPMRLADFAGYLGMARPFCYDFGVPEQVSNQTSSTFRVSASVTALNENSLSWADFPILSNYYAGVYMKRQNSSTGEEIVTAKTRLSEGNFVIDINPKLLLEGTWRIYPFISENIINQTDAGAITTMYSVPKLSYKTMAVISTYVQITITVTRESLNTISYSVKVENMSSASMTFSNNSMWLRYYGKNFTDAFIIGEQKSSFGNVTVPAKSSSVITSGSFLADSDIYNNCEVWCILNNGTYYNKSTPK